VGVGRERGFEPCPLVTRFSHAGKFRVAVLTFKKRITNCRAVGAASADIGGGPALPGGGWENWRRRGTELLDWGKKKWRKNRILPLFLRQRGGEGGLGEKRAKKVV